MMPDRIDISFGESRELHKFRTRIGLHVSDRFRERGTRLFTVCFDSVRVVIQQGIYLCPLAFVEEGHLGLAAPTKVGSSHLWMYTT
jgi:hypothetical protein